MKPWGCSSRFRRRRLKRQTIPPETHVAAAKAAAGQDFQNLFEFRCNRPGPGGNRGVATARGGAPPAPGGGQRQAGPPDRSTWHVEPVKVFDNLYFFGQTEYSVWAITTSQGVIVLDPTFEYSVEDEVVGGMKKMGLDPAQIKPDHDGGAQISSETLWHAHPDVTGGFGICRAENQGRDMQITEGQKLTQIQRRLPIPLVWSPFFGSPSIWTLARPNCFRKQSRKDASVSIFPRTNVECAFNRM